MSNSGANNQNNLCNEHLSTELSRGELGILKKKHVGVHKDLEEQKSGLHSMQVSKTPKRSFQLKSAQDLGLRDIRY